MGEKTQNIFVVGSTALDTIINRILPSKKDLCNKYGSFFNQDFALVIQHPISTEPAQARKQMEITCDSILEFGLRMVVIYPNNDPGGKRIIDTIDYYKEKNPDQILAYKNISFEDYLGIMKIASVMVGNSSSGIIE